MSMREYAKILGTVGCSSSLNATLLKSSPCATDFFNLRHHLGHFIHSPDLGHLAALMRSPAHMQRCLYCCCYSVSDRPLQHHCPASHFRCYFRCRRHFPSNYFPVTQCPKYEKAPTLPCPGQIWLS